MKVAIQNFPKSAFDYPKMNGQNTVSPIKIEDDADETVDESEEEQAEVKYTKKAPIPGSSTQKTTNTIEQQKPLKPQRQFDVQKPKLIEYDDEKVETGAIPLPGG